MRKLLTLFVLAAAASPAAAQHRTEKPLSRAAFIAAVSETAVERLHLRSLGGEARGLWEDRALWDARSLATAFVLGGGVAYLDGLRASRRLGPIDASLRLRPSAARVGLELSWRGFPLTATTQLGAVGAQSFALRFQRAF